MFKIEDEINEEFEPGYMRIAGDLESAIIKGDYKENQKIISTTRLAKKYKMNIATANKAINVLVDKDLLYKKRGVGMFIKSGATDKIVESRHRKFKERTIKKLLLEADNLKIGTDDLVEMINSMSKTKKKKLAYR